MYPEITFVERAACRPLVAVLSMLVGCFVALLLLASLPLKAHASGVPIPTGSRYMSTLDSQTLYREGCAMGNKSGIVVLDFGAPHYAKGTWGTWTFGELLRFHESDQERGQVLPGGLLVLHIEIYAIALALGTSELRQPRQPRSRRGLGEDGQRPQRLGTKAGMGRPGRCTGRQRHGALVELSQATRRWVLAYGEAAKGKSHPSTTTAPPIVVPHVIAPTAGHKGTCGISPGVLGEPIPHRKSTTRLTPGSITSWPCGYAPPRGSHAAPVDLHRACRRSLDLHTRQAWYRTDRILNSDLRTSQTIPFSTDITWNN